MFHSLCINSQTTINRSIFLLDSQGKMSMIEKNQWIMNKIEQASRMGIEVSVDGKKCDYVDLHKKKSHVIRENADYMSDYTYDENGKIIGIHFNKI